MNVVLTLIGLVAALYFAYSAGFVALFSVAGSLAKRRVLTWKEQDVKRRFLVLIPAYKEDLVIEQTAQAALLQNYPSAHYDVCVIADQLQATTLERLNQLAIRVLPVSFEKSTKVQAINVALVTLPSNYDAVVVLDADNIMAPDFLNFMNASLAQGWKAVQGQRIGKNADTPTAILDGLSEDVNNHIYCLGHNALGLSSRMSGSGMAFEYQLFKAIMAQNTAVGGFDKELEIRYTAAGEYIYYCPEAVVWDEKVRGQQNFHNQRRRWIAAQYANLRRFFPTGLNALSHGNLDCFHRVLQLALPPRLLLPVFLFLISVIAFVLGAYPGFWLTLFGLNVGGMLLAIPLGFWKSKKYLSLLKLPSIIWQTLKATLRIRHANRTFIHTTHHN